jgi:hypothetical protein
LWAYIASNLIFGRLLSLHLILIWADLLLLLLLLLGNHLPQELGSCISLHGMNHLLSITEYGEACIYRFIIN